MKKTIKIATRASKLALWQAEYVALLLQNSGFQTELVPMETKGDKILNRSLSKIGSKGVFTEELEEKLRTGEVEIAVHSAKDLQATLPSDLQLIAFTKREKVNDVVVSFDKNFGFEKGKIIGTSSVRRVAFLKHYYPDIQVVDMRGNLQTRLSKLERGDCHALILAYAGVHRMGCNDLIVRELPINKFIPAVGQGSIAVEASINLDKIVLNKIKEAINHQETENCLLAERTFLKTLQGGCSIPAFAHCYPIGIQKFKIEGGVIHPKGEPFVYQSFEFNQEDAEKIGKLLATNVLSHGGEAILKEIKKSETE
ncbi:MAG: hydroxymethylbilane synthase [Flammeovirgaceae bacterium]